MKKRYWLAFTTILGLTVSFSKAQSLSRSVIGSAGDFNSNSSAQLSWTVGEIATETYSSSNNAVTQGFHQTQLEVTSVEEHHENGEYIVFPNPTDGKVTVRFEGKDAKPADLRLFDQQGRLVKELPIPAGEQRVDMQELSNGTYFLKVIGRDKGPLKTFTIQKTD